MYYLSIISPFYNSEDKSHRLLSTLSNIEDKGVQIILVDDGSTDNTFALLEKFKNCCETNVIIIAQENKGPGGARNTGLKAAKGKYVWFIDSDDDINPEALEVLKQHLNKDYDFIDFNYKTKGVNTNSMEFNPGVYDIDSHNRPLLLKNFGRLCTKVLRKDFIIQNHIYYPEYCIYEDNLLSMIYPLITKKFLKLELVAYDHLEDFPSITRSKPSPRYFDRLYTAVHGFKHASNLINNQDEKDLVERRFSFLYLNTVTGLASLIPSKNWLVTHKVLKQYRYEAKRLGIKYNIREVIPNKSFKHKSYFLFQWYLSYLVIGDQTGYFDSLRYKAWGKPFEY